MKAELKVLTSFICYTLIMVIGITNLSVVLREYDEFERELTDYFKCETLGGDCSRSGFENADTTPYTITTSEVALTMYPLVTLIYVVNLTEIKAGLLKLSGIKEAMFKKRKHTHRNLEKHTNSHKTEYSEDVVEQTQ